MPRVAEIGATRDSYVYRLRVPAPLKAQWDEYCEKNDKKSAATLRALMRYMIQDDMPPEVRRWIAGQVDEKPDDGRKERFEILVTPSEKEAIRKRAEEEGCSMRYWIVAACRAGLTKEPQFNMEEIKALGESNYQLLAIGRNLNQIARRMNEGKQSVIVANQIERLSDVISNHAEKVSKAIRSNLERWSIEIEGGEHEGD